MPFNRSTGTASKDRNTNIVFAESSTTPVKDRDSANVFTASAGSAAKEKQGRVMFNLANNRIEGPNITDAPVVMEETFGNSWGAFESGGIAHFKKLGL